MMMMRKKKNNKIWWIINKLIIFKKIKDEVLGYWILLIFLDLYK